MSVLEQIAESWALSSSGGVTSLTQRTTKDLRDCFDWKWCGQCGACCEFPFGFNVPTKKGIEILRAAPPNTDVIFTKHWPKISVNDVLTVVPTDLKTILWCPHYNREENGKGRCGVMDMRKRHPDLFINCNWFDGWAGTGFTKNGRWKLRETNNRHELCVFIVDVLFSPGQYSSFLFETAHKNYLLTGELDGIVPELRKAIIARSKYMGGWFFDAICDGYITALKNTGDVSSLVKFIKDFWDFLSRNDLDKVLQEHYRSHIVRSYATLKYAQVRLLLSWDSGDLLLQSFFPFFFPKKQQFITDPHRGMSC